MRCVLDAIEHPTNVHNPNVDLGYDAIHFTHGHISLLSPHRMNAHRRAEDRVRLPKKRNWKIVNCRSSRYEFVIWNSYRIFISRECDLRYPYAFRRLTLRESISLPRDAQQPVVYMFAHLSIFARIFLGSLRLSRLHQFGTICFAALSAAAAAICQVLSIFIRLISN